VKEKKARKPRRTKVEIATEEANAEIEKLKAQLAAVEAASASPVAPPSEPEAIDRAASAAVGIPTAAEQKQQAPPPELAAAPPAPPAAPEPPAPVPAPPTPPAPTQAPAAPPQAAPTVPEVSKLPHEVAAEAAPANLPARRETTEVGFAPGSDSQITTADLQVPKIHIVQQIGELSRSFGQGEVVFNRQVCIYRPLAQGEQPQAINTAAQFVVLGFKEKMWVERKQGGNGQVAHSKEEVVAMGGVLTYGEAQATGKNWFQTLASAIIMLRQPPHLDDSVFPFEYGDSNWAIAQWSMKGSAYTNGARPIYSARKIGGLRKSWANHMWSLTTRFQSYPNGNSAYVPQLQAGQFCPAEFKQWLAEVLSGKDLDSAAGDVNGDE
jgi:hypothetical protein